VPLASVPGGNQVFNLRVQDLAGNWSKSVNTTVSVQRPNRIFADDFESGGFGFWGSSTGNVLNTPTAAQPTAGIEPGSLRGLEVTVPGTGYLTDNTPAVETSYHARFRFNPNTLVTGTSAMNVLQGRTTSGQAFALQYYRSTSSNPAQVRMVLDRNTGTALVGAWVPLTVASHTLQVDWTAASSGSLKLSVDGVNKSSQTAATSAIRIEAIWLGVSSGGTSPTGKANFDSFASTRFTMP
jgi:hypothetical protein